MLGCGSVSVTEIESMWEKKEMLTTESFNVNDRASMFSR